MTMDCISCGGCCTYSENWPVFIGDGDGAEIPDEFVDHENARMLSYGNRCTALEGTIGCQVSCSIYEQRPLVCREFAAGSEDCLMVRRELKLDLPYTLV